MEEGILRILPFYWLYSGICKSRSRHRWSPDDGSWILLDSLSLLFLVVYVKRLQTWPAISAIFEEIRHANPHILS